MKTSNHPMRKEEVLVYLTECPEHGLEHRIFAGEDILVAGGVHAIEAELERGTERFVRVGVIDAENSMRGITVKALDLAALPTTVRA